MLYLTNENVKTIRETLDNTEDPQAFSDIWSRRSFAPMLIHMPMFDVIKKNIESVFPDYVVTFDTIYESDGRTEPWHCDYETIGIFNINNRFTAIRKSHFLSIVFNLNESSGNMVVLPWTFFSYFHILFVNFFGFMGRIHKLINCFSCLTFWCCSKKYTPYVLHGSVFNPLKLHKMAAGEQRLSYVVHMVKKGGCVYISRDTIMDGMMRSDSCWVYKQFFYKLKDDSLQDASEILWSKQDYQI